MSALTAPFDPAWVSRLTGTLSITTKVEVPGVGVLDVTQGTVEYDEDSAPAIRATLTCKVPSLATLDALDPRLGRRLVVTTGYRVPGTAEQHVLCDLLLTGRRVRRPENVMVLTAASDEQLVMDTRPITASRSFTSTSDGGQAIRSLIQWAVPGADVRVTATGSFVDAGDTLLIDREDDLWPAIQDVADRIGAWVYHDGLGTFHVVPQPLNARAASAMLSIGAAGTITRSEADLNREEFANTVVVQYRWYDGEQRSAFGWAEVTSGPFAVGAVGRKVKTVTIERKGTVAQARSAAAVIVRRAVTRGRSLSLEFEHAPFWLRPGHTATAQLVTGPQDRHLIRSVQFDLPSGRAQARTRQPENVSITTGE